MTDLSEGAGISSEQDTVGMNEILETALEQLRSGNPGETERLCRDVLAREPSHGRASWLLGLVHCNKAEYESAKEYVDRAIRAEPENPFYHYTLGDVYRALYLAPDAVECYERAIVLRPDFVEALNNLGILFHELGLYGRAIGAYERALLINPASTTVLMNLGSTFLQTDRPRDAARCFKRVNGHQPGLMDAYAGLLVAFRESGGISGELRQYREDVKADPHSVEIFNCLGTVLVGQGAVEEALACFRDAVGLDPSFIDGLNNLGLAYQKLGRYEEASGCFMEAVRLKPGFAEAHNNLGVACYGLGLFEEAKKHFEKTVRIRDSYATGHTNLGMILAEEGFTEAARACYRRAYALEPHPGLKVALATLVPVIYRSTEEMEWTRQDLEEGIDALLREGLTIDDPIKQIGRANFYLAYHGTDGKALQTKLAGFYKRICPGLGFTAPHCRTSGQQGRHGRIRIGFLSRHLKNHTIGKYMSGIIAHLNRDIFEVHTFLFPNRKDEVVDFVERHSDSATPVPESMAAICRVVSEAELDILFYPDIGMEPYTYFLAFNRLAPVQCAFYGHPITTGIETVDYFISHELCEIEGSDAHYREKLVKLPGRVTYACYLKPDIKELTGTRGYFGLPDKGHLYLCCQSLFKVHPDFDEIIEGILNRDREGIIVFFHGKHGSWADLLTGRLRRRLGDMTDRVHIIPRYDYDDYMNLVALSGVVLDTVHFNGGATTFDALTVGTPVVTMPGAFMRGRQTISLYQRMGVMDCVVSTPDEYVTMAVRLASDPSYRREIKEKILSTNHRIFEDVDTVRELERLLMEMVRSASP